MNVATTTSQTVHNRIAAIVGAEHTEAGALITASPADAQQASELLRFADESRLSVCAEGSGSKLGWLNPARTDLRLRTDRMSSVREHTWQDMTCTVEAGSTWQNMQTALAEHGQQVALDPLWPERATVGGVLAANDSGSLRLRYGGLRDLVIGMTLVLADGTVARSGGKVVKNVAGYDLPKLLCGSFGTLAFITEVTFRLHSIARNTLSLSVFAPTAEPLGKLLVRLLDSHFSTQSMQLRSTQEGFSLDIRLAALPEVLTAQAEVLAAVTAGIGLHTEPSPEHIWLARQQLFTPGASVIKGTTLPTALGPTMQAIQDLGGSAVAQATGIVTASLPSLTSIAALAEQLRAAGGSLTVLQTTSEVEIDRWGPPPDTLPLMCAIKQQFDPNRILNPGRFIGNI